MQQKRRTSVRRFYYQLTCHQIRNQLLDPPDPDPARFSLKREVIGSECTVPNHNHRLSAGNPKVFVIHLLPYLFILQPENQPVVRIMFDTDYSALDCIEFEGLDGIRQTKTGFRLDDS